MTNGFAHKSDSLLVITFVNAGASVGYKDDADRNCLHYVLRYGKGNLEILKSAFGDKVKKSPQSTLKNFVNLKDKKGKNYFHSIGVTVLYEFILALVRNVHSHQSYERQIFPAV